MAMPPPTPNQSRVLWLALTALAVVALVATFAALRVLMFRYVWKQP